MKTLKTLIGILFVSLLLASCVTGNYVSKSTGPNTITQAPMKLKLFGKAAYTYYEFQNSTVLMYQEEAKFKKKGDTIFMRARTYYMDTTVIGKEYFPQYIISGDSLVSLKYDVAYIKE